MNRKGNFFISETTSKNKTEIVTIKNKDYENYNLFKAIAFVAMIIVSVMNSEVKAQDNFITNEEVKNDLVVAKTIFKQDGTYLYNHMRYEFTYDNENRLTGKTASKWDSLQSRWTPYFKMSYQYENNEIIMSYARWNKAHKLMTRI